MPFKNLRSRYVFSVQKLDVSFDMFSLVDVPADNTIKYQRGFLVTQITS